MANDSKQFKAGGLASIVVLALCSSLFLSACGGAASDQTDGGIAEPIGSLPRIQDSRVFAPPLEDSLAPLVDSSVSTDRWVGVLDGAAYRIEVPKQWNGSLVMWARGYWNGSSLYLENPFIRRHLLEKGYAWAASSYTRNMYDVNVGIEDTNKLAAQFTGIAMAHGRLLQSPRRIYIAGASMGGHIASAAVETEVVRDASNRMRYDGALSLCGSGSGLDWFSYMAAYQMAMQELLGFAAEGFPSSVYAQNKSAMQAQLIDAVTRRELSHPGVARLFALTEQLSGGSRPFYREGWMDPYHHNILFQLMNGQPTLDGILALNAVDTRGVEYRFSDAAQQDAESRSFNATIRRITPDSAANPLRSKGLRWVPLTDGQLASPVMTLHTIGDLTVPIDSQIRYRQRAVNQGNGDKLTQRIVRDVGHCSFTMAEMATAFDDLVTWVEQGQQPRGDDLLDKQLWSRTEVGCRSTDNTAGTEDRANLPLRIKIQSAYPTCPGR